MLARLAKGLNSPRLEILRYGFVGVINTAIDAGGFIALVAGLHVPVLPANVVSYSLGIVSSYVLNGRWTFRGASFHGLASYRFIRFIVLNLLGLALSTLLVFVFVQFIEEIAAKLLTVPIVFFYNYLTSRFLVFRTDTPPNAVAG